MSYQDICAEILRIRTVRKIGVRQMAKEIGVSSATLNRIENGKTVSVDVAAKIGPWAGKCACCGQSVGAHDHSNPMTAFAEWLNAGTQLAMNAGHVIDVRVTTKDGNKLRLTGGAVSTPSQPQHSGRKSMSYAKSKMSEIETVLPYGNPDGAIHFRFSGDYKTFCGRNCEGWIRAGLEPSTRIDSAYCCSRCRTAYLK